MLGQYHFYSVITLETDGSNKHILSWVELNGTFLLTITYASPIMIIYIKKCHGLPR